MGKKYIIEFEDKPFQKGNGDFLYRVKGFNSLVFDMTGVCKLTPYTEPDLEQVREEAFEKGYSTAVAEQECAVRGAAEKAYQKGLSDAWEAARKIASDNAGQKYSIFGQHFTEEILNTHSASDALEEIRAHEQAQKEQEEKDSVTVEDVMRQYLDAFCKRKICKECPLHGPNFTCGRGRHFLTSSPVSNEEVRKAYITVLQKMKEEE